MSAAAPLEHPLRPRELTHMSKRARKKKARRKKKANYGSKAGGH
ncbi:hypothetical protein [Streptomyces sp. STR69]|nr:hypothetical protein [Streptomyces sp. STR69]